MVHAEPPRRSRMAWPVHHPPGLQETPGAPAHRHRTTRALWSHSVAQDIVLVLLTYLVIINFQYVLGRGQYRDAERVADQQRAEQMAEDAAARAACIILDRLPEGPLWDPARAEYGCGPGIAPEELSPEALDQLRQLSAPSQSPAVGARPTAPPGESAGASTDAPGGTAAAPTTSPTSGAESATAAPTTAAPPASPAPAPPLVDLPVTDPLCDALGICL
jgi:hypothetical protein